MRSKGRWLLALAGLITTLACSSSGSSGGGTPPPPPPPPVPSFTLSVTPGTLTLSPGGNGSTILTVNRVNAHVDPVALTVEGAPTGLGATFSPASVTGTSSTLALTATPTLSPQTYALILKGTAGSLVQTATLSVTVSATPTPLAITTQPSSKTVDQGVAVSFSVVATGGKAPYRYQWRRDGGAVGTDSATHSIASASASDAGSYAVTITDSASPSASVTSQAATLAVNPAPVPSFALAFNNSLTLTQGQAGSVALQVQRSGGLSGAVDLSLEGAPAGVTGAFTPASVTGDASTLNLTVGGSVAAQTYNLTVRGAAGSLIKTFPLSLTVKATSGGTTGSLTVRATRDGKGATPEWMAFQAAPGAAWTEVTGSGSGGVYGLGVTDAQGRWGLAWADTSNGVTTVSLVHFALSELSEYAITLASPTAPGKVKVTGSVTGGGLLDFLMVSIGGYTTTIAPGSSTYSLDVAPGTHDLLVSRASLGAGGQDRPARLLLQRNVVINAATTLNFDLNASGFAPDARTATVTGATGGVTAVVTANFLSAKGATAILSSVGVNLTSASYSAIPDARLVDGDLHFVTAIGTALDPLSQSGPLRSRFSFFKSAKDVSLALPPAVNAPLVAVGSVSPYVRLKSDWKAQTLPASDTEYWFNGTYAQDAGSAWTLVVSKAWLGAPGPYSHTFPDFSAHVGWKAAWGMASGKVVRWTLGYVSSDAKMYTNPFQGSNNYVYAMSTYVNKITP